MQRVSTTEFYYTTNGNFVGAIHEEVSVKIGSEMFAGFSNHPFGVTRPERGATNHYAVTPIHGHGVALRHGTRRDET